MNKRVLILMLGVLGAVTVLIFLLVNGTIKLPTLEDVQSTESKEPTTVMLVDDLKNDYYYVWHNPKEGDVQKDLAGTADANAFRICPSGTINWEEDSFTGRHVVWFSSEEDADIPTLYPGDELLYISAYKVPFDGLEFERFADYGYTIGVANMIGDQSGHYRIVRDSENGYTGYLNPESDAAVLEQFVSVSELFLDKLGDVAVRDNLVSPGGTALGLQKDAKYICEWYTGTYYQDFEMTANCHTFCHIESFTTYDYDFLHSNCISITIPDWFKTGYYYVSGKGMFRYVSEADMYSYTGKAYDPNVDWNDPVILYDEYGNLIYNPATGYDRQEEYDNGYDPTSEDYPQEYYTDNNASYNYPSGTYDANYKTDVSDKFTIEDSDIGMEAYEENSDEAFAP